jgi:hypothetical protein
MWPGTCSKTGFNLKVYRDFPTKAIKTQNVLIWLGGKVEGHLKIDTRINKS